MTPEMRAFADKLILDVANVQYVAAMAGKRGLEARVPGGEWTVRQVLGHLAFALEASAQAIPGLAEPSAEAAPIDRDARNAGFAAQSADMPLPDILARMSEARDGCIAAAADLTDEQLDRVVPGQGTVRGVLRSWLPHFEEHSLDLADALPKLRLDPMVLNWILYADMTYRPALLARQQKLATEARDRYGDRLPEPDEEDEE
ncbi:MAG: DinB family protein [Dehalococcoidia bacterium]|nr:DinB family protein [Dehalococcoidia bacterium]